MNTHHVLGLTEEQQKEREVTERAVSMTKGLFMHAEKTNTTDPKLKVDDPGDNATCMEDENTCYVCDGSKYVYRLQGRRSRDGFDVHVFFKFKDEAVKGARYFVQNGEWIDWSLYGHRLQSHYSNGELVGTFGEAWWAHRFDKEPTLNMALGLIDHHWHEGIPTFEHLYPVNWVCQMDDEFCVVVESTPELITFRKFELCLPYWTNNRTKSSYMDNEFKVTIDAGNVGSEDVGFTNAYGRFHPPYDGAKSVYIKIPPHTPYVAGYLKGIGTAWDADVSHRKS